MSYKEEYEYLQIACSENGRCLSCEKYGKCKLREKADFERREREKLKTTVWWQCRHKNVESECAVCPNYKQCVTERGLPFRSYALRNVVINIHKNGEVELLQYKRPFHYLEECANLDREDIDRQRMLKKVRDGVYEPVSDDFTISALQRSIRNAGKRSKDTFMGYAKNNDWEYFITLTFSPEVVNRYDDNAVKSLYSEFQRWCVRRSPDVKMLIVPERHKDGAIHLHGLVSCIEFDLILYLDKNGNQVYSKCGSPLFRIKNWTFGLSTLAIIPPDDNYARVCNYIQKYISKEGNIGYNAKRFYHTRNLDFKNKGIYLCDDAEIAELVASLGLCAFKDSDKMTVYRNPSLPVDGEEKRNLDPLYES